MIAKAYSRDIPIHIYSPKAILSSLLFHRLSSLAWAWAQRRPSRHISHASLSTFSHDRRSLSLRRSISPVWTCAHLCLARASACLLAQARVWRYHAARDLCPHPRAFASPEDMGEGVVPPCRCNRTDQLYEIK
jgi:hypothetical protein